MTAGTEPTVLTAGREILARLLDATPLPTPGAGVEELLQTFEVLEAERARILAAIAPPLHLADGDRALLVELERREGLWHDALAAAQRAIGQQRCGAAQLRAYAQTP